MLAAEGHEHGPRADGGVEALHQPFLGADVQLRKQLGRPFLPGEIHAGRRLRALGRFHANLGRLWRAVGVQKAPGDVHDGHAAPVHAQPLFLGHAGHLGRFQVFRMGLFDEALHVMGFHHHGHALLGFGNGKLGAVQAFVLAGDSV